MQHKRFLFFPLFFPKAFESLRSRMYPKPLIFDEAGREIQICSSPVLHKIVGKKCVWCGQSIDQIQAGGTNSLNPPQLKDVPKPDFNSPTTATVNPVSFADVDVPVVVPGLKSEFGNPEKMELQGVKAYCLRCKIHVDVLDPKHERIETRRGSRTYLKGICALCGFKINAIVGGVK